MDIAQKEHITEKQILILYINYLMYYLPIRILDNMPCTFSESNIKYKLIPRLIKNGMVKRERVGYNKSFSYNSEQKGKALYDTLVLTPKGIKYIQESNLGNGEEITKIREYYKKQIASKTEAREERLKREVMIDFMFNPWFFMTPILKEYLFKQPVVDSIYKDLISAENFRYFWGLECKRNNGNLDVLRREKNIYDFTSNNGLLLSASKFLGIIESEFKTMPIYFTAYKNIHMYPKNEENLISKIISYTGRQCNDTVYIYQSVEKIKQLVERPDIVDEWKNISNIIDIYDYQRIYLLPYGRTSIEFEHLKLQLSISSIDMRPYWQATNCFEGHDYIFAEPFVKETFRNSQDLFISITDDYNYIIGYLPELRHLRRIFRYYSEYPAAKPLTIICDESQVDFYKHIFESIIKQDKLYFSCSKFIKREDEGNA